MKKLLCLCLCMVLLLCLPATAVQAKEEEPLLEVTLTVQSNLAGRIAVDGLYQDNTLYLDPITVCRLTGALISQQDSEEITFSLHGGYRRITVNAEKDKAVEIINKGKFTCNMPAISYNGKVYTSASYLLRYMGATVEYGEDALSPIHLMITMPYTVLDLCHDYTEAGGYHFQWSEAGGKLVDPEDLQYLAALDTIMLGYDSNFLSYAAPGHADNVEKTIHADALLELLRVEGLELVSGEDPHLSLFGSCSDEVQLSANWIQTALGFIDNKSFNSTLNTTLGNSLTGAGVFLNASGDFLKSLDTAKQFSNLSQTQKTLLKQTLNRVSTTDPLYQEVPLLFEAARETNSLISGQFSAEEKAAWDGINSLVRNGGSAIVSGVHPGFAVWEILCGIMKVDPLVGSVLEAEANITFASECDMVRQVAYRLLCADANKMTQNNYYGTKKDTTVQEQLKADMILSLKASLTARLLLLNTGWLNEVSENTMQMTAQRTAVLLNKAQNAQAIPVAVRVRVDEDIRWIEDLVGIGVMGNVVSAGGNTYYWKYSADSFFEAGHHGFSYLNTANTMMCRDANGKTKELFTVNGYGKFVVANNRIFYNTGEGEIRSVTMDGQNETNWGEGDLVGVMNGGAYVVCVRYAGECTINVIDTKENTRKVLTSCFDVVTCHDDLIYYCADVGYAEATMGKVALYSIRPDGTGRTHLYTTEPDLYSSNSLMASASVSQIHFSEDYVYFSYGSLAGTGSLFQGGKIVRVRHDGTDGQVIAGEDELVDADFVVNEDGTVTSYPVRYQTLDSMLNQYIISEGTVYLYDKETGAPSPVVKPGDYSALGSGLAGVYADGSIILDAFVEVVDGKVYYMMHYAVDNPDPTVPWRWSYVRQKTAFFMKDLESGKVRVLYTIDA